MAFGFGGGLDAVALHALQDVGRVAALEGLDDAVVHLPRLGADFVEEPAVVGDDQQRAGAGGPAALEVAGEPGDAFDVQVVRGFVQGEDVIVADQQGGQRHAAALTAGKVGDGGVESKIRDEAREDVADGGIGGPFMLGGVADDGGADGGALG